MHQHVTDDTATELFRFPGLWAFSRRQAQIHPSRKSRAVSQNAVLGGSPRTSICHEGLRVLWRVVSNEAEGEKEQGRNSLDESGCAARKRDSRAETKEPSLTARVKGDESAYWFLALSPYTSASGVGFLLVRYISKVHYHKILSTSVLLS